MAAPSQPSTTGRVKFPPTLGFIRTPEGMVARLANTLDLDGEGSLTILFTGERAEIAERLLQAGGRLDVAGAPDPVTPGVVHVDRFDVPGSHGSHSYGIGDFNDRQEIVALDTTSAMVADEPLVTVTSLAEGQRPAPPVASAETPPLQYEVGQRVRALDRGNLGTIVAIAPDGDELSHHVRFVSKSGMERTVTFKADQIEPVTHRSFVAHSAVHNPTEAPTGSAGLDSPVELTGDDPWEFRTLPDGTARLVLPTKPPHEIRITEAIDADPETYEPGMQAARRYWQADVMWGDSDGEHWVIELVDRSRTELVRRALAVLGEQPSFEPYGTDQRWTRLLAEFAPDPQTVGPGAPTIPPRWVGQQQDDAAPPDREPATARPVQDHIAGQTSAQAPAGELAPERTLAASSEMPAARPSIRVLPVHTRSVDPQTGAISI